MGFVRTHISFKQQLGIVVAMFLFFTGIEFFNLTTDRALNVLGIVPRDVNHLSGIALAPFLHGDLAHYASNIVPLMVFSLLVMQHGFIRFLLVTVAVVAFGGGLVWLLGRSAIHIGASGLVYGYFGFLLVAGFVSREFKLMAISALVWILYGGIVYGVLPLQPHISFESHLFGFLVGAFIGYKWGGVAVKRR